MQRNQWRDSSLLPPGKRVSGSPLGTTAKIAQFLECQISSVRDRGIYAYQSTLVDFFWWDRADLAELCFRFRSLAQAKINVSVPCRVARPDRTHEPPAAFQLALNFAHAFFPDPVFLFSPKAICS